MDKMEKLLLEIFSKGKRCDKCNSPLEIQKNEGGIVLATCTKCKTPYTNVMPVVEDEKLKFKTFTELREFKKLPW